MKKSKPHLFLAVVRQEQTRLTQLFALYTGYSSAQGCVATGSFERANLAWQNYRDRESYEGGWGTQLETPSPPEMQQ